MNTNKTSNNTELENRVIKLEMKIAYLENFIDQLQEMTVQQNKNMDKLQAENLAISEKLSDIAEQFGSDIPNRRPPHY